MSKRRDQEAVRRFLRRALSTLKATPSEVVTDKAPVYPRSSPATGVGTWLVVSVVRLKTNAYRAELPDGWVLPARAATLARRGMTSPTANRPFTSLSATPTLQGVY